MVKLILISWRDIPSQVIAQRGRRREKAMLSQRFQEAIDRAAMRAGKGSSDLYLEEWRRERRLVEGDIAAAVAAEVARLEAEFPDALDLAERREKLGELGVVPKSAAKALWDWWATDPVIDVPAIDVLEFRGDLIAAHWGVTDMAAMMQQMGVGGPPA